MEFDSKTLAILTLVFIILFWVIWNLLGSADDWFDEFWEDLNWKDDEVDDDEETKRTKSGKK